MDLATEWMGRYRPLVAELVKHTNVVQRSSERIVRLSDGLILTAQEWQAFEYIIEHQSDDACMNHISERLGIAQSTFSKIVKSLCQAGLVDKYQTETNRKNIILRPSEEGLEVYRQQSSALGMELFENFFRDLDSLTDEQLAVFTRALENMNTALVRGSNGTGKPRLIKKT